jgi:peptidoglycan hydrolase CwlO-like protein
MTVILNSRGFGDLLNQVGFMQRVAHQNTSIVGITRASRAEVLREATRLAGLESRDRTLANQVLNARNQIAALQSALLHEQLVEMGRRSATRSRPG